MSRFGRKKTKRFKGSTRTAKLQAVQPVRSEKRVAICTPCGDHVRTEYCISLIQMVQRTIMEQPKGLTHMNMLSYGSSILPFSRQVIATIALENNVTHTLWIDSDMRFPDDMLISFLKHEHPIIGINAMARRPPYRNTAQSAPKVPIQTRPDSTGLEKVFRTGFGVMWIATEVFRSIEPPWFDFEYNAETGAFRGEDYYFHEKAKKAGFDCYIDHDISKQVLHMGTYGFNPLLSVNIGTREISAA